MWIRNKNTGLKWDVPAERANELIETGEYEGVNHEESKPSSSETVKPGKRNAKPG